MGRATAAADCAAAAVEQRQFDAPLPRRLHEPRLRPVEQPVRGEET
jgi:hypothetical protein